MPPAPLDLVVVEPSVALEKKGKKKQKEMEKKETKAQQQLWRDNVLVVGLLRSAGIAYAIIIYDAIVGYQSSARSSWAGFLFFAPLVIPFGIAAVVWSSRCSGGGGVGGVHGGDGCSVRFE